MRNHLSQLSKATGKEKKSAVSKVGAPDTSMNLEEICGRACPTLSTPTPSHAEEFAASLLSISGSLFDLFKEKPFATAAVYHQECEEILSMANTF